MPASFPTGIYEIDTTVQAAIDSQRALDAFKLRWIGLRPNTDDFKSELDAFPLRAESHGAIPMTRCLQGNGIDRADTAGCNGSGWKENISYTLSGKYFNTLDYAEIAPGENHVDVIIQAEEAGAGSSGILAEDIDTLVDPIPYIAAVKNTTDSTGGLDVEDDTSLTQRIYLAPSKYSSAGPRDAYEYYVREWRSDVEDVQITSPSPCVVEIYVVMEGGRLPNETEQESLTEYINGETIRPLCDLVSCQIPEEIPYTIDAAY